MIFYHGQISRNLILDYIGTGNDRYGIGLYFTSDKELAQLFGQYIFTVESNDYKILNGDINNFKKSDIQKALNFFKDRDKESYDYLWSDWDSNENIAIKKIINTILNDETNLEITQSIWYIIFRNREKMYLDFMQSIGIDGIEFNVENGIKYLILYTLKSYKELDVEGKVNMKRLIQSDFYKGEYKNDNYYDCFVNPNTLEWGKLLKSLNDVNNVPIRAMLYEDGTLYIWDGILSHSQAMGLFGIPDGVHLRIYSINEIEISLIPETNFDYMKNAFENSTSLYNYLNKNTRISDLETTDYGAESNNKYDKIKNINDIFEV